MGAICGDWYRHSLKNTTGARSYLAPTHYHRPQYVLCPFTEQFLIAPYPCLVFAGDFIHLNVAKMGK